ncbi:MAG: PDR/VanB family oxidoreductase [Proteobacteria bacterium]|nr:PDR/VanB family oxidoreductase [Pseudomonadota bacterium]MDA1332174.1 PDR/VanB family oxidoreductase [Pseudomonadota bacterium]
MSARIIMKLTVERRDHLDDDLVRIWLGHPLKPQLPAWSPGAHVDLRLGNGKIRQYSLTSNPQDLSRYAITVKREKDGRGGSSWIHEHFIEGFEAHVSAPRNNFALVDRRSVLIAGGVGVTPLISMGRALAQKNLLHGLHFCSRRHQSNIERELKQFCGPLLSTYISFGPKSQRLDLMALIGGLSRDLHIYCCGPERLMAEVKELTSEWNQEQIHFEVFKVGANQDHKPEPFDVIISSTGKTLRVPENHSVLDILRMAGHIIPSSCRQGVCGTCECGYISGEVIHRDSVLSPAARRNRMMPCVSRARVSVTLDL